MVLTVRAGAEDTAGGAEDRPSDSRNPQASGLRDGELQENGPKGIVAYHKAFVRARTWQHATPSQVDGDQAGHPNEKDPKHQKVCI